MNPVADKKMRVSSPGAISERHWGISSSVPLAGGRWVAEHSGGRTVEAVATHATLHESDFRTTAIATDLPWTWIPTENGGFAAVDDLTGIYGVGADRNLAVQDLLKSLQEHLDVLEHQEALSPGLEAQMEYLRSIL
jgi:hypothetical protein